jgi:hypothetical protein
MLTAFPRGAAPAAPAATASLDGYVREAGSRAAIPNAFVILSHDGQGQATVADRQGHFVFPNLAPGRYGLAAAADAFAFDYGAPTGAILEAGRATTVDIVMSRGAVIAGEVRDATGNLRRGVSVTVIRKVPAGGTDMPSHEPATTDNRGQYRVDRLAPGDYFVLASPTDKPTADSAVMPTYFPSVTDQKSAVTVAVVAGQTVDGVDVTMQVVGAYEITGTVVDEEGRPVRAMITFVSQSIQTWVPNQSAGLRVRVSAVMTRADGTFRIVGLGSGSYRLTPLPAPATPPPQLPQDVTLAAVNGNRSTKQVDVHDASVNGVTIVLQGAPASGR